MATKGKTTNTFRIERVDVEVSRKVEIRSEVPPSQSSGFGVSGFFANTTVDDINPAFPQGLLIMGTMVHSSFIIGNAGFMSSTVFPHDPHAKGMA